MYPNYEIYARGGKVPPLYKCLGKMEDTICEMAKHFRALFVRQRHYNLAPINIRLDLLAPNKVYIWKTKAVWLKKGGIFVSHASEYPDFDCDATFWIECPGSTDMLDKYSQRTRSCVVVWYPPTWRLHEEAIAWRMHDRPFHYRQSAFDRLQRMRDLLDAAPQITPAECLRLRHAPLVPRPPQRAAPVLNGREAHAVDTGQRVP